MAGTVYHGLPDTLLTPQPGVKPEYLAFLGRICPEKRVDTAIRIAAQSGLPLKIAAKVDKADADYFKEVIEPLLDLRRTSNSSARSTRRRSPRSCPARRRCCSRSTGRSRSAW